MNGQDEIKDILVLSFLKEGLSMRNGNLLEQQQKVAMTLLAKRNNLKARREAYRVFVSLEKAISSDYRSPTFRYHQSFYYGKKYLEQNNRDLEYGRRHRRVAQRVFQYLKSRMSGVRQYY